MQSLLESVYLQKKRHIISETDVFVPISRPMWDRILGQRERIKALHITDFSAYQGILNHSGKGSAAQFSFMARVTNFSVFNRGVATSGGVVYECTGYPVIHAGQDIYTQVDKDGMRWLPAYNLFGNDDSTAEEFIREAKQALQDKWIEMSRTNDELRMEIGRYVQDAVKVGRGGGEPAIALLLMELPEGPPGHGFSKMHVAMLGKMQYEVIKHYMEQMEVLVKKYISIIKKELQNRLIVKQKTVVSLWDEVILSDIKIENCYFLRSVVNDIRDSGGKPTSFLAPRYDNPDEHLDKVENEIESAIGKSIKYVGDNEVPRVFGDYLDKGEELIKEGYDQQLKNYVELLQEDWVDFGKGIIAAHLANWGIGEVQKFISGKGVGSKTIKLINKKLQLDLSDWEIVLRQASAKEKLEVARECKDISLLYHMAFNWAPFNNNIKLIRRELIKNPQFVHQLQIKLLQQIAPFDVHSRKRIYKHPTEYDATLEKKLRKSLF